MGSQSRTQTRVSDFHFTFTLHGLVSQEMRCSIAHTCLWSVHCLVYTSILCGMSVPSLPFRLCQGSPPCKPFSAHCHTLPQLLWAATFNHMLAFLCEHLFFWCPPVGWIVLASWEKGWLRKCYLIIEVSEFPLCSEEKCYKSVITLPSMCDL